MLELTLLIYGPDGANRKVRDWLVFSDNTFCQRKLKHFCQSVGLDYEAGAVEAHQCEAREGYCALRIEPAGKFPAKNVVDDYREKSGDEAPPPRTTRSAAPEPEEEDDIPFN